MLAALNQLVRGFAIAHSLQEVAELAASSLVAMLPERGVLVQLWSPGDSSHLEASVGPEMSSELHSVELNSVGVRLGEITIDAKGRAGVELCDEDKDWIEAVSVAVTAATRERHALIEQRAAQLSTVLALTGLLERCDPTLGRHFDRMRSHCRTVAEVMRDVNTPGVDEEFILDLSCACILHDIGKVAIPDSILLKPGRLTREEWAITKTHTQLGADTLDDILRERGNQKILALGRDIAMQHHERWNGGGYPNGLKGDEVSLAARIVAVVDVYDALTHDRPFRAAWTHEDAVDWIERRSGEEFDPDVVDCFLVREAEIEAASRRMADAELSERHEDLTS